MDKASIQQPTHNTPEEKKPLITIRIKFVGTLREALSTSQGKVLIPPDSSLLEALISFARAYGKPFQDEVIDLEAIRLQPFINVMINGRNALSMKGLETILQDQDELLIIPPIIGGSW